MIREKLECGSCKSHIAVIESGKVSFRFVVRNKVFQVYTIGGAALVKCRVCGKYNFHADPSWQTANQEEAARLAADCVVAVTCPWLPRDEYERQKTGVENA